MLLLSYIKENQQAVVEGLEKRRFPDARQTVAKVVLLDDERRSAQAENDSALHEMNTLSRQIGQLMKDGRREEAEQVKSRTGELKGRTRELGDTLARIEKELEGLLLTIPNIPGDEVPAGASADDNDIVYQHGQAPILYDGARPHWDLIREYDIIDFDLGIKITGAGFPVYKGEGARLQRALVNFFLEEARRAGYTEIQPPIVINEASGLGTGQLPDKDGQMYYVERDDLYLIPSPVPHLPSLIL